MMLCNCLKPFRYSAPSDQIVLSYFVRQFGLLQDTGNCLNLAKFRLHQNASSVVDESCLDSLEYFRVFNASLLVRRITQYLGRFPSSPYLVL